MLHGLYVSAAGLAVNGHRQQIQANNLANVATVGFKPDRLVVQSRAMAPDAAGRVGPGAALERLGGGVWARRSVVDFAAGRLESTGEPLDIALDTGGRATGFLAVRSADGGTRWTRDGRMMVDAGGQLLTQAGRLAVLDDAGQPIRLDAAAGPIAFSAQGEVLQNGEVVGRLGLAGFEHPWQLVKQGEGNFAAPQGVVGGEFRGQVIPGFIETSAVESTAEMAAMINTMRAYEANANMIKYQDQTLGRAVNEIARLA